MHRLTRFLGLSAYHGCIGGAGAYEKYWRLASSGTVNHAYIVRPVYGKRYANDFIKELKAWANIWSSPLKKNQGFFSPP